MPGITTSPSHQPTSVGCTMSSTTIQSPIYHPRTPKQLILVSPGRAAPGWITHIASLLDPNRNARAAFQDPRNDPILTCLLSEPRLISLCKSFNRTVPTNSGQAWTAHDEAYHDDGRFGKGNLEREWVVEEVLDDLKQKGVNLTGFDESSTFNLRAVEVEGPFEVGVDEGGHEWVVEVPDRRHVFM